MSPYAGNPADPAPGAPGAGEWDVDPGDVVDRMCSGQRLSAFEREHLESVIGRGPARDLARHLSGERKGAAQRAVKAARPKTLWEYFFGPIHTSPEPLPNSVAVVLLRLRDGEPIGRADLDRLVKVIGRRAARELHRHLMDAANRRPRGGTRRRRR